MFSELYKLIEQQEEKTECPLYIFGIWMNTNEAPDGSKAIDAEHNEAGAAIIETEEELTEFLEAAGITAEQIEEALRA